MLAAQQILNKRYQLQQKLGERPARQTWLARDIKSNFTVIIKLLAFGGQVQWNDLKLFEREAQILKELDHPFIPKYCDYFSTDERILWFALVEQYIPGSSLQNLLDLGKRFTESEVKNIALKLLNILSYLHQLAPQVLHRDLKPSNIILSEDRKIYLVDFGAVQNKAAAEGASFTIVGTYGYTPMEQFGGRAVTASDLYALGATIIHLLTGTPPADLPQKDLRIQFRDRVRVSQHLADWLEKITEPALEHRFSSVSKAKEALKFTSTLTKSKSLSNLAKNKSSFSELLSTKIEIFKNDNELKLTIPYEYTFSIFKILIYIVTLFGIYLPMTGLLSGSLWIVWILSMSFIVLVNRQFLDKILKDVYFNRKHFVVRFIWNNSYINSTTHSISKITKVYSSHNKYDRSGFIIVQLHDQNVKLAQNLTRTEADLLVQEINDWLNID